MPTLEELWTEFHRAPDSRSRYTIMKEVYGAGLTSWYQIREGSKLPYAAYSYDSGKKCGLCSKDAVWHAEDATWDAETIERELCHDHYDEFINRRKTGGSMYDKDCWTIANKVLPYARRALLWGPPGTGKTRAGRYVTKGEQQVMSIYITEYTPVSEPRGNIFPVVENGERVYKWFDGPATTAFREGYRLVINEINNASDDCITFFLNLLDDEDVAQITLPTGEVITPHPNFSVVATMNGEPNQLLEALRDRFPITLHIDKPNPDAIKSLPTDLQAVAASTAMADAARRRSIRIWKSFGDMRAAKNVDVETALWAHFGAQAPEIMATLKMNTSGGAASMRAAEDRAVRLPRR